MANVLFCVIVLFCLQQAFGNRNCNEKEIKTCDECIRCGGNWCSEPGNSHCSMSLTDDWCIAYREDKPWIIEEKQLGNELEFTRVVRTAEVMESNEFSFKYKADIVPKIDIKIINSTQGDIVVKEPRTTSDNLDFKTTIIAKPTKSFCWENGTASEFVHIEVHLEGFKETLAVKYHVPCACNCSSKVEKYAAICKGHGDYSCGTCSCYPKWTGVYCETPLTTSTEVSYPPTPSVEVHFPPTPNGNTATPEIICPKRGDIAQCSGGIKPDVECSGNGYCGPCETCICYTDREGSQYFDQDTYCTDLCMLTNNDCEDCLANRSIGECQSCRHLTIQSYNETLRNEMDGNMKVWVKCNETIDNCLIEYVAKKTNDGQIFVMIEKTCDDGIIADEYKSVKVSITLGVLGMLAALAAVAGVMYYKYLNATQPLSSHMPGYSNIDAEDCTGINPLYKPPTTKFTNPTYGKKL